MKKLILMISIVLFVQSVSYSQENEVKRFSGYINEEFSKSAVQFGAIKNMHTGEVTLTDGEGFFNISGSVGDTLRFHSLGYRDSTWIIPGVWYAMDDVVELKVQPNIYSLNEVEVVRYYSYAHFKQAFKNLELEKTEKEVAKERIEAWQNDIAEAIAWGKSDKKAASGTFGVSFGTGGTDKITKKRKELKRLEEINYKSTRFNYFVSRDNIKRLTEYEGVCLDSFMVFINTQYNLTYQMPEYELLASILRASTDFKNQKGSEDWFLQSMD